MVSVGGVAGHGGCANGKSIGQLPTTGSGCMQLVTYIADEFTRLPAITVVGNVAFSCSYCRT